MCARIRYLLHVRTSALITAARSRRQLEHGSIVGGAVTRLGLIFGAVVVVHSVGNGLALSGTR